MTKQRTIRRRTLRPQIKAQQIKWFVPLNGRLLRTWHNKGRRIRVFEHDMGIITELGDAKHRVVFRWGDLAQAAERVALDLEPPAERPERTP